MSIQIEGNLWIQHGKVVLLIAIELFVCQKIKSNRLRNLGIDLETLHFRYSSQGDAPAIAAEILSF
ncbi:hypothetical protein JWG41_18150 [Leptospira sp. 201903075]|uniref:hypothetical protein n=1 Tax=Leptospira chreensis TaxID=2810035 RepID=UPI00196531A9|nr:hypothetical protein [Leptospira chreensis]MBM9592371.1 hypothetical protein [Leptospira chreensis]